FADADEKVFNKQAVVAGNNNLTLQIPLTASAHDTFARLRLSSVGGLNFDGPAPDGEAGDYRFTLVSQASTVATNPRAWYAQGQVWVVWTADTRSEERRVGKECRS